jgi:ATP-dependent protease HslVU (ClpYQ) peptidase subunit
MMNAETSIRVLVTREVLQTFADASADRATLIAKFDRYRRQFEAIASDKFDRGDKSPIRVTRTDVIKFAADRRPGEQST